MSFEFEKLKEIVKGKGSASVAYSNSGAKYFSPFFKSATKILSVSAEHIVLIKSIHNNDFEIYKVETLLEEGEQVNPLSIKVLSDYSTKTGNKVSYKAFDKTCSTIFETDDVIEVFDFYKASESDVYVGDALKKRELSVNVADLGERKDFKQVAREYAKKGMERNFTNYDGASAYGSSLITKSGKVYFGGQYSTFDGRLGVHAETALAVNAFSEGDIDIEYIGLASTKYKEIPVPMCGCCREFWNEYSQKYGINPKIYSFALENDEYLSKNLEELLPFAWRNK